MPRFLLHIGANKTGTSSIQRMLVENRAALAAAGWGYPEFQLHHCAHHLLAYALAGHPDRGLAPGWREGFAVATADQAQRYIISSELFFRNVAPEAAATLFPPDQTRIVLWLRDHLGYMMSWYAQAVQERNLTASFEDYVRLFPQPFSGFLARWEAVYPDVVVRPFARADFPHGDIRQDFLGLLGGVPDAVLPKEESNPTISGNLLFFKRLLNHVMSYDEAYAAPIPDEFGAYAGLDPRWRGRFAAGRAATGLVARVFDADRKALAARGLAFGPIPEQVTGHALPDYETLQADVTRIAQVAEETGKAFLPYARRLPVWQ